MTSRLLVSALLLALGTTLPAQTLLRTQADKAVEAWDYTTAIVLYQQILTRHANDVEIKAKLADCYRLVNDPEHAERWYAEVVQDTNCKPVNKLYYGMMLQANGKCTEAKPWFAEYNRERPDDDRGKFLAQSCDQQELLLTKSRSSYVVAHLPINSNMDDFAPAILGDRLLFASDRDPGGAFKRVNMWTGAAFCEIYALPFRRDTAHFGSFAWGKTERYSRSVNSKFHEASVTFSADTQTIYFTRNNYLDGKTGKSDDGLVKLKIYSGKISGADNWGPLQELPFCSDEYSTAHPSLSADGQRLFFASNKPGGYGGMDIYVSHREGDRWGLPFNSPATAINRTRASPSPRNWSSQSSNSKQWSRIASDKAISRTGASWGTVAHRPRQALAVFRADSQHASSCRRPALPSGNSPLRTSARAADPSVGPCKNAWRAMIASSPPSLIRRRSVSSIRTASNTPMRP